MLELIKEIFSEIKKSKYGFTIDEIMTGEHHFEEGCGPRGRHFLEFVVTWGPKDVRTWIDPNSDTFLSQTMEGTVTVGGLCVKAPCQGKLELKYFSENKIRYSFEFKAKGKTYVYVGEKVNIWPWNLPVSHTTCFGRITEKKTGKLISTSVVYFKLKLLPKFLSSLRFTSSPK